MEQQILLEVTTPEQLLVREQVSEVIIPGTEGEFGVRPGHCNFLSTLKVGELRYLKDDEWHYLGLLWGYAHVEARRVTVLAQMAERPSEIDLSEAEEVLRLAEKKASGSGSREEMEEARTDLEKAQLRAKIGRRQSSRH